MGDEFWWRGIITWKKTNETLTVFFFFTLQIIIALSNLPFVPTYPPPLTLFYKPSPVILSLLSLCLFIFFFLFCLTLLFRKRVVFPFGFFLYPHYSLNTGLTWKLFELLMQPKLELWNRFKKIILSAMLTKKICLCESCLKYPLV